MGYQRRVHGEFTPDIFKVTMTRIALLTLFLAFTATSGNIARLKERTDALDVDVPFARLGQEHGTRLAKLEPTDEDPLPLLVELEPVGDEADSDADLTENRRQNFKLLKNGPRQNRQVSSARRPRQEAIPI